MSFFYFFLNLSTLAYMRYYSKMMIYNLLSHKKSYICLLYKRYIFYKFDKFLK